MKLRYPPLMVVAVTKRIILCNAMPRSTLSELSIHFDINQYMSASISRKIMVLSPTSAWSWLSAYEIVFSSYRRLVVSHQMEEGDQSSSFFSLIILIQ